MPCAAAAGAGSAVCGGKSRYAGLHAAAAKGDTAQLKALIANGARPDIRDRHARTPLHVAAYGRHHQAMLALVAAGANPNALERDRYNIVTIAAVANDVATLRVALELGAPLDHVNNLGWTALIESIVLGNGGTGHTDTLRALVEAKANVNIADRNGRTPLALARGRHYGEMAQVLERAGGK